MARQVNPAFHLLEINLISAQDLAPITKNMRTYAVAWVNPDRKLTTRVDVTGHSHPTWNEKFVFRVDDKFLSADTSSIMIEIYTAAWLRDVLVGSVNVLIGNLFASHHHNPSSYTTFVALQIRRPSGRPQGILNMGFSLLDSTMKSMPLYSELSASAVGIQDLIDTVRTHKHKAVYDDQDHHVNAKDSLTKLRRSQSDKTGLTFTFNEDKNLGVNQQRQQPAGSICGVSVITEQKLGSGSIVNGSLCSDVGPSASVVAAAIARGLIKTPATTGARTLRLPAADDAGSSILDGWTEKDSEEGVKTKLERWRAELQPIYDHLHSRKSTSSKKSAHMRRKTEGGDGGNGLFSCFGTVFG
ncbi:C2 domain-containing protein [Cephalotus follicularis]|uniref:C2 domain-containing protein n=1 Tax=Cephalotus follicularis TaxID=3775 RepID=A0A1Q3CRZ4_CEPFO|nr:C2 domain-containing protein [Cephalotus follicularis]